MTQATATAVSTAPGTLSRASVLALVAALVLAVALLAGPRSGALLAIGLGFGLTLEGLHFGFTGVSLSTVSRLWEITSGFASITF